MREIKMEPIRSVERVISILNCFGFERPELYIEDIVKETGLPKPTVYRMLWTLEKNGLIHYDSKENKYRLGHKFLEYGGIVMHKLDILKESEGILRDLHKRSGHTVILAVRRQNRMQYLLTLESDDDFQPRSYVGRSRVLHYGALGIVILSHMEQDEVEAYLQENPLTKWTPYTVVDRDLFVQRLAQVKSQGYYVDVDETFVGFSAISAPLFGSEGKVLGAIGVAGASHKMEGEYRDKLVAWTREAGMSISQRLGYFQHVNNK